MSQRAGLAERYHYWKTEGHFWLGRRLFRHNDPDLSTLIARWLEVPRKVGKDQLVVALTGDFQGYMIHHLCRGELLWHHLQDL